MPLTPVPVPISTTALALPAAASRRSTEPAAGGDGGQADLEREVTGGLQDGSSVA